MLITRKLYSNVDGECVSVNETKMYSGKDDAKGAAKGAGAVAAAAGLGAAGLHGVDKWHSKLQNARVLKAQEAGLELGNPEKLERILTSPSARYKNLRRLADKHKLATLGIAAGAIGAGAGIGAGVKHLKNKKAEEKQYSVLMTEDELRLYSEILDEIQREYADSYEDLNYTDLIQNTRDKNPLTIKKLREWKEEHLSKEKGKGRALSAVRSAVPGIVGGAIGAGYGYDKGKAAGAILGGLSGAALGAGAGYGADRAGRRLRNKIRKSGGGGTYDDMYARKADRLAMLNGKMSKDEFKKKWYRNDQAR